MSAFRFRLARLLRIRGLEERLARERWLAAELGAREDEKRAELRRTELAAAVEVLRAEQSRARLAPAQVLAAAYAIEGSREARNAALERARVGRQQAEALRRAWIERDQERKGLERLEARDRDLARATENAQEARAIDEIALVRAARRARAQAHDRKGHDRGGTAA